MIAAHGGRQTTADLPLVAMEDREADQLGLEAGDRLGFEIQGEALEAQLAAVYSQRRLQSRFWFEAIFSDGTLDRFVTRYVGHSTATRVISPE